MFTEALSAILQDHHAAADVRRIEAGGDAGAVWAAVAEAGFLDLMTPESHGGAGLPLAELYDIVALMGRQAIALPLAESIAARALVAPGTALPATPITLASAVRRDAHGALRMPRVPHGAMATHALAAEGGQLLLIEGASVLGSANAGWHVPAGATITRLPGNGAALPSMAAAIYAALMAGAAERCLEMTLAYANQRVQFGKALGKFQAVQQQLSLMAEQVAAMRTAAEAAFQGGPGGEPPALASAIAKARCSEAAAQVADIAHALHGAIGVTHEYDLQLYTRRLRAWRVAHGSEDHWNQRVGEALLEDSRSVLDFIRD